MKVVLTGATGFLGWHTRIRLGALTDHDVVVIGRGEWPNLAHTVRNADAIIHVAGVNRGDDADVEQDNVHLAQQVSEAVLRAGARPRIIFANSIHSGNDSAYGRGKFAASDILDVTVGRLGSHYVDVQLPNLFGEHGRPGYNSFVATFADAIARSKVVSVDDREVELLHAQQAAQVLIDALACPDSVVRPPGTSTTVASVLRTFQRFHNLYTAGDIPALESPLDLDLFNVLRAATFPGQGPIQLAPRADSRGSLVEVVRAHGGEGQTFVSTTKPGVTRGEHFHLRKVERFVVLSGRASICLRRMYSKETVRFDVNGDTPVAVDMPTMWAHNITNTGNSDLMTLFWTNQLFDPKVPDTYAETVGTVSRQHTDTDLSRAVSGTAK